MTRDLIRETLATHLCKSESVLAMWEAGSAAWHRTDQYSDLDVAVLAKVGSNAEVWQMVDQAFEELGGVKVRWNEPTPLFAGLDKRIFQPRRSQRWLQVDIGIFPETAQELYNQVERHGQVIVIFDRTGRLKLPPAIDLGAQERQLGEALHQNLMKWQVYHGWFRKEAARDRNVDAFMMHLHLTVMPLLNILNIRYRPNRFDFGFRYLKEELPADVVRIVERLCYVSDPTELEQRFDEAERLLRSTLKELEREGVLPIDGKGFDISLLTSVPANRETGAENRESA